MFTIFVYRKQAKEIPLFKSGKSSDPSNYRPISVLSALSKQVSLKAIWETHEYILAHLNKNNLLHPNQSGFRENYSCHTALTSLVDQWLSSISDNKFCGALFVDFAKAFDVTDRDLLLRKLAVYGLYPGTLTLLASFLTDRKQTVHVNASTSDVRSLKWRYSFPFTSITSLYSSKHVANFLQMTQQSTAVTLISESCRSHYMKVSTVCKNG